VLLLDEALQFPRRHDTIAVDIHVIKAGAKIKVAVSL
jgi:hypothetical protein